MSDLPIVALMYDFDRTLCTKNMQGYSFIPSLGMTDGEFWDYTNELGLREHMDSVLAYMYAMVKIAQDKNIALKRESLVKMGENIEFFKGVEGWFDRINRFGIENGVQIEHYVISSGVWPKTDVNYTNKTQFVYRINKGVLDVANDVDLNRSMPDDSKRVPFCNMIYIGDGLSDVPCMKMMKAYGGYSIAVYQKRDSKVEALLNRDRVDFIYPADYSDGTGLDMTVKNIIKKMAIADKLTAENSSQKKNI